MPSPPPGPSERSAGLRLSARRAVVCALAGGAVTVAALAFDAGPLFVPGLGFLLLALLAPGWVVLAASSTRLRRRVGVERVVEDEPVGTVVEISRGLFGLPGGELREPLAGPAIRLGAIASEAGGGRKVALRMTARVHRRGRHRFAPPDLVLSDPFGLVEAHRTGAGGATELLVLPRLEPVHWRREGDRRPAAGMSARAAPEPMGAGEIDGLRTYMPGTPASRIHWPALARGVGLLERRLVAEHDARPLVVLDARTDGSADGEERLDAAVRAAGSLTLALARGGGCRLLLPGDAVPAGVEPDLAAWSALHARLAVVESEIDPRHGPRLRPDGIHGPLLYVAAGDPAVATLPLPRSRRRGLVLVLPRGAAVPAELPVCLEVAGCVGYALGVSVPEGRAA